MRENAAGAPRWVARIVVVLVVLTIGVGVGWAVRTVLTPAKDPLAESAFTYVKVSKGTVGSSLSLNTVAAWTLVPVAANRASGVVTGVAVKPGAVVAQGTVLYRVDERPVAIAQGDVPAYRAISRGDSGADVSQLQQMLTTTGHYHGSINGTAGTGTVAAIRAWQKVLGVPQTGVVELPDLIFVPQLPTRVSLDPKFIARGLLVSGGEQVVSALPAAPSFTVAVTDTQAGMMPAGTEVDISAPEGGTWKAAATDQTPDQQSGNVVVHLKALAGDTICDDQCAQIPVGDGAQLSSKVVTVATVNGLVVPSAALITSANGSIAVIDAKGTRIRVTVAAAAQGMSVVKGVDDGTRVRVPAVDSGAVGP